MFGTSLRNIPPEQTGWDLLREGGGRMWSQLDLIESQL